VPDGFEMVPGAVAVEVNAELVAKLFDDMPEYQKARVVAERASDIEVCDATSVETANTALIILRTAAKKIDALCKDTTRPFREAADIVRKIAGERSQGIDAADRAVTGKITDWHTAERVQTALIASVATKAANEAVQAAMPEGVEGPPVEVYIPPPPKTMTTQAGTVTVKKHWVYRIVDAAKIPRSYCVPSPGLLQQAVRSGIRDIPGVDIFEEPDLSTKRL
jgi:hypothetical protein